MSTEKGRSLGQVSGTQVGGDSGRKGEAKGFREFEDQSSPSPNAVKNGTRPLEWKDL